MKVILFGATGMVGQGVLRECLLDPDVERVLAVGRSATGRTHEKLRDLALQDLSTLFAVADQPPQATAVRRSFSEGGSRTLRADCDLQMDTSYGHG